MGKLTEIDLVSVAGVLAPHRLEVDCTNGAVSCENGVKTSVVVLYMNS